MTMVFDRSHKEIIGGPITIEDDEPATKYRAESDGRTFWAYNGMEVFYEDERMYGALDLIESLQSQIPRKDYFKVVSLDDNTEFFTKVGLTVRFVGFKQHGAHCFPEFECVYFTGDTFILDSDQITPCAKPDLTKPPCYACGAQSKNEALDKCFWDCRKCHGSEIWAKDWDAMWPELLNKS